MSWIARHNYAVLLALLLALYPPSLPPFHGIFANIANLLQSDVMIYIIKLVLQRSIARWSKSWSEAQLEKVKCGLNDLNCTCLQVGDHVLKPIKKFSKISMGS